MERGIVLVPEGRRIFVNLTVKENLRAGAFLEKRNGIVNDLYTEVFDLFPRLKERQNQMGGTLSGGEQQMLAVGRAMMARPKLMMLDEPSLGLAPIVIDEMFEKIQQINRDLGTTILLVEQNAFIALEVAHRGYVLSVGPVSYTRLDVYKRQVLDHHNCIDVYNIGYANLRELRQDLHIVNEYYDRLEEESV